MTKRELGLVLDRAERIISASRSTATSMMRNVSELPLKGDSNIIFLGSLMLILMIIADPYKLVPLDLCGRLCDRVHLIHIVSLIGVYAFLINVKSSSEIITSIELLLLPLLPLGFWDGFHGRSFLCLFHH
jgi:hypothetical protein